MSLQTDLIFVRALQQSGDIDLIVDDRIYMTAIPRPEEELVNEPLPYIIVTFDGITPQEQTKDAEYDTDTDTVSVGIVVVAETRPKLAELSELVRSTIKAYFEYLQGTDPDELSDADKEMLPLLPYSAQPSGGQVIYNDEKPCYWLTLQYQCDVNAFTDDEY